MEISGCSWAIPTGPCAQPCTGEGAGGQGPGPGLGSSGRLSHLGNEQVASTKAETRMGVLVSTSVLSAGRGLGERGREGRACTSCHSSALCVHTCAYRSCPSGCLCVCACVSKLSLCMCVHACTYLSCHLECVCVYVCTRMCIPQTVHVYIRGSPSDSVHTCTYLCCRSDWVCVSVHTRVHTCAVSHPLPQWKPHVAS